MSERYVLRDPDNRDDNGASYEFSTSTLAEMIPYVDGPLRNDTLPRSHKHIDRAIDYLRRERFDLAEQELRKVGVYLSLDVVTND